MWASLAWLRDLKKAFGALRQPKTLEGHKRDPFCILGKHFGIACADGALTDIKVGGLDGMAYSSAPVSG